MRIALVTTTINLPTVLHLYRKCSSAVKFFVTGDTKSPDDDIVHTFTADKHFEYFSFDKQETLGYKCFPLIGPKSIQLRNIAFLEAAKWGAEIIVSIDDDNIPLDRAYFNDFERALTHPCNGLEVSSDNGWFDVGQLFNPTAKHRGFPHNILPANQFRATVDAQIGIAAGLCLGDPDIDASTRMVAKPIVHHISEILRSGVTVHPGTHTVFNSQNTAIRRSLLPAWGMIPFVGRMDDIYASLIVQRIMRERNLCVRFGPPMIWQQRNQHNLVKDMRGEIDGYENVEKLASILDQIILPGISVIQDCRMIWGVLGNCDWMPARSTEAMLAWLDDCEAVGL